MQERNYVGIRSARTKNINVFSRSCIQICNISTLFPIFISENVQVSSMRKVGCSNPGRGPVSLVIKQPVISQC